MKLTLRIRVVIVVILSKVIANNGLSCEDVLELPAEKKLTLPELKTIPPKDMVECLAHLGKEQLPTEEADYIWQSIVMYYGGIQNIPDKILMILHYVTVAIRPEDYQNITLSNIDVIDNFGLDYNLNQDQRIAIADKVREDFAGKEPEDYTYYDLMALKQILCQFNSSEIERIHPSAYREAALMVGKLKNCGTDVLSAFARLALHPDAFGRPSAWTEGTIKIMGQVAEYLPKEILNRFNQESKEEEVTETIVQ